MKTFTSNKSAIDAVANLAIIASAIEVMASLAIIATIITVSVANLFTSI